LKHDIKLVLLVIIAARKQKDALLTALPEFGAHLLHTTYAKGSVKVGSLPFALGFIPEKDKVIITCVLSYTQANIVFSMLSEKFRFGEPNTGISFTIPVENIAY
jgi:hypothetical protein